MIFRILETKKGTYRTNSSYFLHEIEELLEQSDLNERFGWLFKEKSNLDIECEDKILENVVKVGSSCRIEPQSLIKWGSCY